MSAVEHYDDPFDAGKYARTDPLVEAERGIVSAVLANPDAVRFAVERIRPDDFADTRLAALFSLAVGLRSAGVPLTHGTVLTEVAQRRDGGRVYPSNAEIADLVTSMAPAASVGYFADIVRGESIRRRTATLTQRWHQRAIQTDDPAQLAALAAAEFAALRDDSRSGTIDAPTLGEVLEGDDDYEWVIPGLLERGDRFVLTGQEGGGKTTLIRQIAICAAAGVHPFTRQAIDPVDVLYIDVENTERQWRRKARGIATQAASIGGRDPRQHLRLVCTGRMDITTDRALGAVHRLLDEHQPGILVIGPLYKLVPGAITNDDDAAPLITALDSLRERGVCLLMEAHAGHAVGKGGERDLRPRGSSALLGWPEFGYGVQLKADDPQIAYLVRWRGDRDEREWPAALARGGQFPWNDLEYQPARRVPTQDWNNR